MFTDNRIDLGGAEKELDNSVAQNVFTELEIYLNKSIEKISDEYWQCRETENKEKQNKIAKTENREEILNYYKTTNQFLYELMYWYALRSRQIEFKKLYLCCKRFKINTLLDFGGGVGGLSIFMSQYGLKCDYLDVSGKTSDFARWRFNRRNLGVVLFPDLKTVPDSVYDGVVAHDVLEHLFDIEETIREMNRILNNRGYFVSRSTFGEEGMHLSKNKKFKDMKIFDDMMRRNNFSFLGQLKPNYFSQFLKNIGFKYVLFGVRIKNRLKYGGNFIIYQKN